jgi:hypothetical protein
MLSTECTQMDAVLDDRGGLLSDEAVQHLNQCPHCRSLYDWVSVDTQPAPISPALSQRIVDSLRVSLTPVKPLSPRRVSITEFIVLFVVVSAALASAMGVAGLAHASLIQIIAIAVPLITGMGFFSVMLANQMRPGSYQPVSWNVVLTAIGVVLLTAMAVLFPWEAGPRFLSEGLPCLVAGLGIAAPVAALLWLIVRRGAPLSMIQTGGTLGATAGLVGVAVLQIKCPHQEAAHLLAWHASVLLTTVGVGMLAGWLGLRASDRSSNGPRKGRIWSGT